MQPYGVQGYGQSAPYPPAPTMGPPGALAPPPPPASFVTLWYAQYYNMIASHEWFEIQQWFYAVDQDRSGSITAQEIARCTFGGAPLGFETARKLVRVFDTDGSGNVSFHEYASLHKFVGLCQQGFFAADRDRSGRLALNEIFTALAVTQMGASFPSVQALFNAYVRDPYGLTFSEFLQLAAHIAATKTAFFQENALQGNRGVVQLDFDKVLFVSAKIV